MNRGNLELCQVLIRQVVAGKLAVQTAAQRLGCHVRTIRRYRIRFIQRGPEGLKDRRGGNHRKLTRAQGLAIVQAKRQGPHRSARWIRDHLKLKVHERTVWEVLVKNQLNRTGLPSVKPIERFEAPHPNELWQIDLQGKVKFPHLGWLHLVLVLDDHSRFILAGGWFRAAHKVNVFACLYRAFMRYGLPKAILSDRGSQFHPTRRRGQSDFEEYMDRLGITLILAKRARTKGKIERRFEFVQRDFVLEHLQERLLGRLNEAWQEWMAWYNHHFHSRALGGHTASQHYRPSSRRRSKAELQVLLTHEEPRRVRLDGTISYYGMDYRVPPGYLKCRVWTKLRGDTLRIESHGQVIAKHKLAS